MIGYRASHLCKLGLEFEAMVTGPACYDIGDLVMDLMGNGSYGSVMGVWYREEELREVERMVGFRESVTLSWYAAAYATPCLWSP